MKLGLHRSPHDYRTLALERYVTTLPPAPSSVNWGRNVSSWGMLANDRIGDCAIAGPAHQELCWTTADNAAPYCPTESEVIAAYRRVSGYVPGRPSTDVGCNLLDVMKHWKSRGIGRSKIEGYARLSAQIGGGQDLVKQAIWAFGGVTLGLDMPYAWQSLRPDQAWDAPRGANSAEWRAGTWGGHCVIAVGYDRSGLITVTWGRTQRLTWRGLKAYGFECWVPFGPSLWGADERTPAGFDADRLRADAASIR